MNNVLTQLKCVNDKDLYIDGDPLSNNYASIVVELRHCFEYQEEENCATFEEM